MRGVGVILLAWLIVAPAAHADENNCASGAGNDAAQCEANLLKSLNRQLDRAYNAALLRRPVTSNWDQRKTRAQLAKSQKAWKAYVEANCEYQGGVDGGESNWVTVFSLDCQIDETRKRISFLRAVPGEP
jgi:uncharacterized protein YecT (DUF1311 family)